MYNILTYGAIADGRTLNTEIIQAAIDDCHRAGGGRVVVPAGVFVTGTLYLKSHVELHLSHGAVLKASDNPDDYNEQDAYPENSQSAVEQWVGKHLIIARECVDVAITGSGSFDGSGDAFFEEPQYYSRYTWKHGLAMSKDKEKLRPGQLICFILCRRIAVREVTIFNAPCWCLFFHGCTTVSVTGLKVHNPLAAANTDGIDIDCCQYVTVSDCLIDTGDDAIAIRCDGLRLGERAQPCAYITVSNCVLASSSSVFRIGVGTGSIHHVRVSNIVIPRGAVGVNIQTRYGKASVADIRYIDFSDISGTDICYPFYLTGMVGCIRHVTLRNMRFDAVAGSRIFGHADGVIEDVAVSDCDLFIHPEEAPLTRQDIDSRGKNMLHLHGARDVRLERVRIFDEGAAQWESRSLIENCDDLVIRDCML